jgi:hypothetical protein
MIHPVLDRLLVAKRLAAVNDINFGDYGIIDPLTDEVWLEYSYYNDDTYT